MADVTATAPAVVGRRAGPGRPALISREQVLQVATTFSLEELTMAKVAAQLGVTRATVYNYFPSRASLISAVYSQLRAGFEAPSPEGLTWQEWLLAAGFGTRELMATGFDGEDLLSTGLEAACVPVMELFFEVLVAEGFASADAYNGFQLFMACCLGSAILLRRTRAVEAAGDDLEVGELLDGLGTPAESALRRVAADIEEAFDPDEAFRQQLAIVIAGLELRQADR